jgi:molybdopterin synthase sulfur carrier subunit
MPVKVLIPTPLRNLTANAAEVSADAASVSALIEALEKAHPGLKERLCDESGKLRRFVNVYLNEEDIRFLNGEATALKDGDEVSIVPAIAGGL